MEKLVIYKNKGETFQCHFDVDGVNSKDVEVRLCLEFGDNKNLFFYGTISESGECDIQIPKLNELENKTGKLSVEAIADSTYFKLYECEISLKNSVDVKMKSTGKFFNQKEPTIKETKIQLTGIEKTEVERPEPVYEEQEEPIEEKPVVNPFIVKKHAPVIKENHKPTTKSKKPAKTAFGEYLQKRFS